MLGVGTVVIDVAVRPRLVPPSVVAALVVVSFVGVPVSATLSCIEISPNEREMQSRN